MLTAEFGLEETAEVELVQHPFESWIRHCARCENGEDPVRWAVLPASRRRLALTEVPRSHIMA